MAPGLPAPGLWSVAVGWGCGIHMYEDTTKRCTQYQFHKIHIYTVEPL